jgi:hypothetical protein
MDANNNQLIREFFTEQTQLRYVVAAIYSAVSEELQDDHFAAKVLQS